MAPIEDARSPHAEGTAHADADASLPVVRKPRVAAVAVPQPPGASGHGGEYPVPPATVTTTRPSDENLFLPRK